MTKNLVYQGSGAAKGSLYLSGDRDFRINEHDGYLRLVTTQRTGDSSDTVDHKLSILKLNIQDVELDLVSTLPNSERPEAIGKPNEALYGVRFMGDALYLVTFERTDPLYVVDLSKPTDPMIAGELMVTGFSDFLHAVNDDLLMGLGQDENGLVKLELFNVADMTAPYSLGVFPWVKVKGHPGDTQKRATIAMHLPIRQLMPAKIGFLSQLPFRFIPQKWVIKKIIGCICLRSIVKTMQL